MGGGQSSTTKPLGETRLANFALLAWLLGGPNVISQFPQMQKGKYAPFLDQIAGGGAGNLPGTILPNFQSMLAASDPSNSFFGRSPQYSPMPTPTGIGGISPLQTIFRGMT